MTTKTSLSIALSQEELFVVLAYLKGESLPGFEIERFKKLSEQELSLLIGIAERALVARGFLKPDSDNQLKLEPAVFAIVGACAFPEKSLMLTRFRPNAMIEEYFFHISRKMIVMHTMPVSTIHQFIAAEDKSAIIKAAVSILNIDSLPESKCPQGQIKQNTLDAARDIALEKGIESASTLLSQGGLDKLTAQQLSTTLSEPVANTLFAYVENDTKGISASGFTVLQGKNALWLLSPGEDPEHDLVSILSVSSNDVIQRVKILLK
jgi:hypothetical protein